MGFPPMSATPQIGCLVGGAALSEPVRVVLAQSVGSKLKMWQPVVRIDYYQLSAQAMESAREEQ